MKKVYLKENITLQAIKKNKNGKYLVDYYILVPGKEMVFAFQRNYTKGTYNLCKNGIRINKLTHIKTRDTAIMNLVEYTKRMLSYFVEYYELPVA